MTLLPTEKAAREAGMKPRAFLRAVRRGEFPGPVAKTRPFMFSVDKLRKALAGEWTPAAPSEGGSDPLMERLDGLDENALR